MDDILCNHIRRRCLCTKNNSNRCLWNRAPFNLQIFVNDIQRIHLLTFVLMKTFDLNVKYRILVQNDALCLFQIFRQKMFVFFFDV